MSRSAEGSRALARPAFPPRPRSAERGGCEPPVPRSAFEPPGSRPGCSHRAALRAPLASAAGRNEFKRLFTHLFGGGTAELQLVESDDPLEAGLEILARPPGKRPQTMTLLSGGEQALTALALIFAVFLTNPAPICVLDEVDAPLEAKPSCRT